MHSRSLRAAMVSVCLLAVSALLADDSTFTLSRGVIVDGGREALYLPDPTGEIEAIDLSAGRLLWSSSDAALPLAVEGSLLVAQAEETRPGRLPIVVFDVAAGGRKVVSAVLPLPDDVRALIADEKDRSFRVSAQRQGNEILISWTYRQLFIQGVAPESGEPRPTRTVTGSARLDLSTGAVITSAATEQRTGVVQPVPVPSMESRRDESPALQVKAAPPRKVQKLAESPLRSGNVMARWEGGRGGPLTLKRWDVQSAAPLPDLVLVEKAIVALASAAQTHLLASERVGEGGPQDPEYRWSIFSVDTGERVAELRRDASAAPFFVWHDAVVFESRPYGYRVGDHWVEEPLKIRSIRLSRGVPTWDRPVRHLEYRGPLPPVR